MAAPMSTIMPGSKGTFFPVFNGNVDNLGEDAKQPKKINSQLNNAKTKHVGLLNLHSLLSSCYEDVTDNVVAWMKVMSQIIIQNHEPPANLQLAAENFKVLLKHSSQIPPASREVSSNVAASVLANLLQANEAELIPVLTAIHSLLIYYPTACGALRSRIVKFMLPLMMLPNENIRCKAISCWSQVPLLGGGGTKRSTHSAQLESQFEQTLQALKFTFQRFVGEDVKSSLDPSIGSLSLPLPELTVKEPEVSHVLVQRLCMLSECLDQLLELQFPNSIHIPVNDVVKFILSVLDVTPSSMGYTSEMLLRASCLHMIQGSVLKLFCKLAQICQRNLCRYSSAINRTFSALLDSWKDKSPVLGRQKRHSDIRKQIYVSILHWIQMCGTTCRFLSGPTHQNQSILKHLIDDVTPMKDTLKISSMTPEKGGKAKRRKLSNVQNSATCGNIQDSKANSQLCSAALEVIVGSISTMNTRLSSAIHKSLQETIIPILLQIQQGSKDMIPYASCPASRLLLYRVLLAVTQSPSPSWPPPIVLSTKILKFAASHESNLKIKKFCNEAVSTLDNIAHPWRSSWHRCSVDLDASTQKPTSTKEVIEPLSLSICSKCGDDSTSKIDESIEIQEENEGEMRPNSMEEDLLPNGHFDNTTALIKIIEEQQFPDIADEQSRENGIHDVIMQKTTIQNGSIVLSDDNIEEDVAESDVSVTVSCNVPNATISKSETPLHDAANSNAQNTGKEDEDLSEDVENMLVDFVDASPEDDEKINNDE